MTNRTKYMFIETNWILKDIFLKPKMNNMLQTRIYLNYLTQYDILKSEKSKWWYHLCTKNPSVPLIPRGFIWGLVAVVLYFFFRPNHLLSNFIIISTMIPEIIPANTEKRKEYNDIICAPPFRHQYRERQRWDYNIIF